MRRKKKKLTPKQQRRRLITALVIISTMFVITFINIDDKKTPAQPERNREEILMDASLDSLLLDAGFDSVTWSQKDTLERIEVFMKDGSADTLSIRKVHFGDYLGKTHVTFQSIDSKGKQKLHYTGPAYSEKIPPVTNSSQK